MVIYLISSLRDKYTRTHNITRSLDEAKTLVLNNDFDLWEGYSNHYMVIESMEIGNPLSMKEEVWFTRERFEDVPFINKSGLNCVDRKAVIYEIDKPQKHKRTMNFSIG